MNNQYSILKAQNSKLITHHYGNWPIVGHKQAIQILQAQIKNQKLSHAYLFSGPAQIGKFRLACIFSQTLLCQAPKNLTPCQKCLSCQRVKNNSHPDLKIISPQKAKKTAKISIPISDIRAVKRILSLSSHSSKYKIIIIDQAHFLGAEAASALLKTLEEPPQNSILILITDNEKQLFPTILSRLQKIFLKTIDFYQIKKALLKQGVSDNQAEILAHFSAGKMGQAFNLARHQTYQEYLENISKLTQISSQNNLSRLKYAQKIANNLDALPQILNWWLCFFRDVLLIKIGSKNINYDYRQKLKVFLSKDYQQLSQILIKIQEIQRLLAQNINPKLLLENLLLEI